jgi:hypothetical protein
MAWQELGQEQGQPQRAAARPSHRLSTSDHEFVPGSYLMRQRVLR